MRASSLQRRRRDLLAQLVDLRLLRIFLAKLLLDRLQLLAQEELALALVDPLLDLAAQLVAKLEQLDLAFEQCLHPLILGPQPVDLQDLQALLHVDPQTGGDQIQQAPRAVLVHGPVDQLVRQERRDRHQPRE